VTRNPKHRNTRHADEMLSQETQASEEPENARFMIEVTAYRG